MIANKPYVKDGGRIFTPIYLPGETYSFFINSDFITDGDVDEDYILAIVNGDGVRIADNFPQKAQKYSQVDVGDTNIYYQLSFVFVFPYIPDGQYRFIIYSPIDGIVKATSNVILCSHDCCGITVLLKYRNAGNIFNYNYDALPLNRQSQYQALNFYNSFRLPLNQINLSFEADRTTYRNASNGRRLRTPKSFLDLNVRFESLFFDDEGHYALAAVLEHDTIIINDMQVTNKTPLTISTSSLDGNLSKGTFEVYLDQFPIDKRRLENYGDIYYCGDFMYSPDTIINGNL